MNIEYYENTLQKIAESKAVLEGLKDLKEEIPKTKSRPCAN